MSISYASNGSNGVTTTTPAATTGATNVNTVTSMESESRSHFNFIAGGISGTVASVITCPLEVVKTRLQSMDARNLRYRTTFGLLKDIAMKEGVSGLFRGIGPIISGVAPGRAIYFMSYQETKRYLSQFSTLKSEHETSIVMSSACVASFVTSTVTNPIWMIKTRLQLSPSSAYNDTTCSRGSFNNWMFRHSAALRCGRDIWREEGISGFYRGMTASYVGVSETILQFVIYERLKSRIDKYFIISDKEVGGNEKKSARSFLGYMASAGSAKGIASALTYPHEVVRTRLREERELQGHSTRRYRGFLQCLSMLYREEGIRGLYRGMPAHLLRVIPNSAVMFSTFELTIYLIDQYKS